jgi:hypothetical protein
VISPLAEISASGVAETDNSWDESMQFRRHPLQKLSRHMDANLAMTSYDGQEPESIA